MVTTNINFFKNLNEASCHILPLEPLKVLKAKTLQISLIAHHFSAKKIIRRLFSKNILMMDLFTRVEHMLLHLLQSLLNERLKEMTCTKQVKYFWLALVQVTLIC